jgi:hypothetical protein
MVVSCQKWVQEDSASMHMFCTCIPLVLWQQLPKEVSFRMKISKNHELLLGTKCKDSAAT